MDNTTQLFIRACKVENPQERVRRTYRRFYSKDLLIGEEHVEMASILEEICTEYDLLSTRALISALRPTSHWFANKEDAYWKVVVDILISAIRLSSKDKLTGYRIPARFRKT